MQTLSQPFQLCFHSRFYSPAGSSRRCSELGFGCFGKMPAVIWTVRNRSSGWARRRITKTQSCISKWNQAAFTVLERTSDRLVLAATIWLRRETQQMKILTRRKQLTRRTETAVSARLGLQTETPWLLTEALRPNTVGLLLKCSEGRGDVYGHGLAFPCDYRRPDVRCKATDYIMEAAGGGVTNHRPRSILQTLYKTQSGKVSAKSQKRTRVL